VTIVYFDYSLYRLLRFTNCPTYITLHVTCLSLSVDLPLLDAILSGRAHVAMLMWLEIGFISLKTRSV